MKKVILSFALVLLLALTVQAESVGRYQITSVQLEEEKGITKNIPVMIDTKTGRSWYLAAGQRAWYPMLLFPSLSKMKEEELRSVGAVYSAEDIKP